MKLKVWMIIVTILIVILFWFCIMTMFYKFLFMVIGIASAIFGTILVVKIIAPIVNMLNRNKRIKKSKVKEIDLIQLRSRINKIR